MQELLEQLRRLCDKLATRMSFKNIQGQNLVLKLKYDNFEIITRSICLPEITNERELLYQYAEQLLVGNWDAERKVRLIGIGVGKLDNRSDCEQLSFLP